MDTDEEKRALWSLRAAVVDAAEARDWPKIKVDGDDYGGSAYRWDMQVREADEATCRRLLDLLR